MGMDHMVRLTEGFLVKDVDVDVLLFMTKKAWAIHERAIAMHIPVQPQWQLSRFCESGTIFQGSTPWVAPACADCPGFLVLGSAPAPASTLVSDPQIVPLG